MIRLCYFYFKHFLFHLRSALNLTLIKSNPNSRAALMFHSVRNEHDPGDIIGITLSEKKFTATLNYLKINNFKTYKASEFKSLFDLNAAPGKSVLLTFDDGYLDNYSFVFPLLKKHNMKATIFISPGELMERTYNFLYPLMSIEQIREMHDSGLIEIGIHSNYHRPLNGKANREKTEMILSAIQYFEKFRIRITSFSYPHGTIPENADELFPDTGIQYAFCSHTGYPDQNSDPYQLPRLEIARYSNMTEIKAKLNGVF